MQNEKKNKIHIIITNQADLFIEKIIEHFNLHETEEDYIKKRKENKLSKRAFLYVLIKKITTGEIEEKELIAELQKGLEVDAKKAQEIAKELIEKVVPLLQKVTEEQLANPDFLDEFDRKYFGGPGKLKQAQSVSGGPIGFTGTEDLFPKDDLPKIDLSKSEISNIPSDLSQTQSTGHALPKNINQIETKEEIQEEAPKKRGRPTKFSPAQMSEDGSTKKYSNDLYREKIE